MREEFMKRGKRMVEQKVKIFALLVFALFLIFVPGYGRIGTVKAGGEYYSGENEAFQKWSFDPETGKLSISRYSVIPKYGEYNDKVGTWIKYDWCEIGWFNYNKAGVPYNSENPQKGGYPWEGYRNEIKEVWIAKDITEIGPEAFKNCKNLKKVTFEYGSELINLNESCFEGCSLLDKVNVGDSTVNTLPDNTRSCSSKAFAETALESFVCPEKMDSIVGDVFINPNSGIVHIEGAFSNCKKLKEFSFEGYDPVGDGSIGKGAFYGCSALSDIKIPEGISCVDMYAFGGCTNLKNVTFDERTVSSSYMLNLWIDEYAFSGCTSIKNIELPTHMNRLGEGAFKNCTSLETVKIRESNVTIDGIRQETFKGCTSLREVYIPQRVQRVYGAGDNEKDNCLPFDNSKNLKLYVYSNSQAHTYAKKYCVNYEFQNGGRCGAKDDIELKWYYDSNNKELVITGNGAMKDYSDKNAPWNTVAKNAEKITIETGCTCIGDGAFFNLSSVKEVIIANSVETIGKDAFNGCTALTKVDIPNTTTTIGEKAFCNCTSLKNLSIPDSVKNIGEDALKNTSKNLVIKTPDGSVAADYAEKVGVKSEGKSTAALKQEAEDNKKAEEEAKKKNNEKTTQAATSPKNPKKGETISFGGFTYKVTKAGNAKKKTVGTVTLTKATKKNIKKVSIGATVKIDGITYKVTAIGANAFKGQKKLATVVIGANVSNIGKNAFNGCSSLQNINIKSTKLKTVGTGAFKGINKKATIKVPKAKKKAYTKLLSGKGQAKSVKVK